MKISQTLGVRVKRKTTFSGATAHGGPRLTMPISVFVTLGAEVHEQMLQYGIQLDTKPPVYGSQASLVPIYRPTERMSRSCPDRDILMALHFKYDFWHMTATAGSDVVQSGRPIFDDFFQHLWLYIGNNTANVVFQMVKRLWLIRIDQ
ncbi:adhesion G protein-coupled receptor B2 [Trichonephila clavipes]|nr:adhesion G protein-coupled receptor B2 [Trichonephila clavipes]